jgi:CheY-like chemotaxis protein
VKAWSETNILIVDDEVDLAELVSFEFEMEGSNVLVAENGNDGFALVQENPDLDVVISDIRMPGGDGIELLVNIKKKNIEKPPVIFMSGFADITLEDAYAQGASAIFPKPFNRVELTYAVQMAAATQAERWGQDVVEDSDTPTLKKSLESMAKAHEDSEFRLGKGGFFIKISENFPTVSKVIRFEVDFEEGDVKKAYGFGKVRWVRRDEDSGPHLGCGVEILKLDVDSMEALLNKVKTITEAAFIPK